MGSFKKLLTKGLIPVSAVLAGATVCASASAQTLTQAYHYQLDWGADPTIALGAGGLPVDIHTAASPYSLVVPEWAAVWWHRYNASQFQDGFGLMPVISGNGNSPGATPTFVEVHTQEVPSGTYGPNKIVIFGTSNAIMYRTATASSTGALTVSPEYGVGVEGGDPAVATGTSFSTTQSVLVYQSDAYPFNNLMYQVGTRQSNGTISWSSPTPEGVGGWEPSVAMIPVTAFVIGFPIPGFVVVEAYNTADAASEMAMRTGWLPLGATSISWNAPFTYDWGLGPHVALCQESNGTIAVVEVHAGQNSDDALAWYHLGTVTNALAATVSMAAGATPYGSNMAGNPSVSCSGNTVVEEHVENWSSSGAAGDIMTTVFTLH